jgi:hypothetical protein
MIVFVSRALWRLSKGASVTVLAVTAVAHVLRRCRYSRERGDWIEHLSPEQHRGGEDEFAVV